MMGRGLLLAVGTGLSLVAAAPVDAHHSFAAEFDAKGPVTLRIVWMKASVAPSSPSEA